jgi:4-hydroxy-tetrahydrodipicolinate reductase
MTKVCLAGATGWTGSAVGAALVASPDLQLSSAVSRSAAGSDLGRAWGQADNGVPVFGTVEEALDGCDVLVDYTSYATIREHTLLAVERGVHVVVGSSGLSKDDLAEIDARARAKGVGVFAAGNFSLTATLMQLAALAVVPHLPSWEIVDYASATKPDSPSGTSRELAESLAEVRTPYVERPVAETGGFVEARGATVAGTQIHSVRLPGYDLATEVIFGLPHERLVIRHESAHDATQFVGGTLLAIRKVVDSVGVVRGLASLLLSDAQEPS